MRVEEGFQPTPYPILHPYSDDIVLPALLSRLIPSSLRRDVETDLIRFGDDVRGPIRELAARCDPPTHTPYDQWGKRVDEVRVTEGWKSLKAVAAKEGLISLFYEREKFGEWARVYGFMKTMIYIGDSRVVMCPMSMTDGCTRVLELMGTSKMKQFVLPRLISRDPKVAYTAGQWMTERAGGSDVSETETIASAINPASSHTPGSAYTLDGFKWFSSAIDGNVSLALGRTGSTSQGSRSLSLFLVPLHNPFTIFSDQPRGSPLSNKVHVHRLKQKIGTHFVPTAELSLEGTIGFLVGPLNQGVKSISPVLNITRLHSCIHSIGSLSRCLQIARAYATVRVIPNSGNHKPLSELPLHTYTLSKVSVLYRALAHLTFGAIHLLGRQEAGVAASLEELRLRMLTPVCKAFVATYAVGGMEECMTALGGQGYMEENEIGRLIRDCLVEKIWEGTPNVLALDLQRATRDGKSVQAFVDWGTNVLAKVPDGLSSRLSEAPSALLNALQELPSQLRQTISSPVLPRPFLFLIGYIASSLYLLEHAIWSFETKHASWKTDADVVMRWVDEDGLSMVKKEIANIWTRSVDGESLDYGILYGDLKEKSKL